MSKLTPTDINLRQKDRILKITFQDGETFELSCEYLRVHSPSAEVQGHSPDQAVLQLGKENVNITGIEPVGNYAVLLRFDDGHDTGIYSWETLYNLGNNMEANWAKYLARLEAGGHKRKATSPWMPPIKTN